MGLEERLYADAMGHDPDVSRKYYLDKFEPGVVSAIDEAEYQAAYQRRKGAESEASDEGHYKRSEPDPFDGPGAAERKSFSGAGR